MIRLLVILILANIYAYSQAITFKTVNDKIQYDTCYFISDTSINIQEYYKSFITTNYSAEGIALKAVDNGLIYSTYEELSFGNKSQGKVKCWHLVEIKRIKDSLSIKINQIKLQSFPELNTPDPKKELIEEWYRKYLARINKGKQAKYFEEYLLAADQFSKKLMLRLIEYYQL